MVFLGHGLEGDGLSLGAGLVGQSGDRSSVGGGGGDGIVDFFKDCRDRAMTAHFKTEASPLATTGTIAGPGFELIMLMRGGGDIHEFTTSDALGRGDGPTDTSGGRYSIK